MKINKRILGQLDTVYAPAIMKINGTPTFLAAGDKACMAFNESDWKGTSVWDERGGTMNIVPIPGRENEFIATRDFYAGFQAKESKIVHAKCDSNFNWVVNPIMTIPYLHRFDLFLLNNKLCFIGSTLCDDKEFKEDWSKPGKVYVGEIGEEISEPFALRPILEGITKNHGFCKGKWNHKDAYLISGVEGVFALYLPKKASDSWEIEQLLHHEISDMAICDIDNDGCMELATIEPFHGNRGIIYKNKDGKLSPIYEYEYEFGHVVWGGKILNKPSFIIGGRDGHRELNCFQTEEGSGRIKHFTIDNTGGPTNIAVLNTGKSDLILAANRDIEEITLYEIFE
ncbi:hypothetical protein [Pelosinus sp. sgz500959]|uniref:hypothetical protein n=1 Tax=Pelosinus sp. sgz500959 TaxID=3242472 RepID=UPI00366F742B